MVDVKVAGKKLKDAVLPPLREDLKLMVAKSR
jgi:hypothetical protein